MSVVPLRFRNWWEEWDREFQSIFPESFHHHHHPSRIFDENFAQALNRDDFLSTFWGPTPSWFRNGYLRPWTLHDWKTPALDSRSTVNVDDDKFELILDVQQFKPSELSVKTTDHDVVVEGKHEEHPDEHGHVYRHFIRRYQLPSNVHRTDVTSTLSSDGVLTVIAPLRRIQQPPLNERSVPIASVGPKRIEDAKK